MSDKINWHKCQIIAICKSRKANDCSAFIANNTFPNKCKFEKVYEIDEYDDVIVCNNIDLISEEVSKAKRTIDNALYARMVEEIKREAEICNKLDKEKLKRKDVKNEN
jgi:hypothetical protein